MRLYKKHHFWVIFCFISISIFLSGCNKGVRSFQDILESEKFTVYYFKEDRINLEYIRDFTNDNILYFVEGIVFVPEIERLDINLLITEDFLQEKPKSMDRIKKVLIKRGRVVIKTNKKPRIENLLRNLGVDTKKNEFIQFLKLQENVAGIALYLTDEGLNIGFSSLQEVNRDSIEHYNILLKGFLE